MYKKKYLKRNALLRTKPWPFLILTISSLSENWQIRCEKHCIATKPTTLLIAISIIPISAPSNVNFVPSPEKKGKKEVLNLPLMILGAGFHPTHSFDFYLETLRAVKKVAPKLHIKAFTAAEIRYFSKKFRKTEEKVLEELKNAGLDSLPGGGAEIFDPEIRKKICGPKGPAHYWLDTHKRAHALGFKSTATMLYGHIETAQNRVNHMEAIRNLQDESGGFMCFIPLAFNPKGTEFESKGYTSGIDDLKTLAIARIFFDNIKHIKAYWIMSGVEMAQLAQHFGADDLHGTVMEENITHMAGGRAPVMLLEANLHRLIREAGRIPIQRDSLYNTVRSFN